MVIKRKSVFIALLITVSIFRADELPCMPLCRPTLFSCLLDSTIELWNNRVDGGEHVSLKTKLRELFTLSSLLVYQKEALCSGNIEYLLSIFDGLEHTSSSIDMLAIIGAIKKELIALL